MEVRLRLNFTFLNNLFFHVSNKGSSYRHQYCSITQISQVISSPSMFMEDFFTMEGCVAQKKSDNLI